MDEAYELQQAEKKAAWVAGLREVADAIEKGSPRDPGSTVRVYLTMTYEDDPAGALVATARAMGGRWEKSVDDQGDYRLERSCGPHTIILYVTREAVCERVVTGTRTVTREVPDPEAPPVPLVTVTEEIEDVDWICPPSLLALEGKGTEA